MTAKFCTKCGAELSEDQKFCTKCGTAKSQIGNLQNDVLPQQDTIAAPNTTSSNKNIRKVIIGAAIAVAVILIVALITALALNSSNDSQDQQSNNAASNEQSTSSSSSASSSTDEEADNKEKDLFESSHGYSSELDLYNRLVEAYDKLSEYNEDIKEAAINFNNTYASSNYSIRLENSSDAKELLYDIQDDRTALYSLLVSKSSINSQSYEYLLQCYFDCEMRISVIAEAWELDLGFSDPENYRDYILSPIARDNENGTNKYLTDFNATFPLAFPIMP